MSERMRAKGDYHFFATMLDGNGCWAEWKDNKLAFSCPKKCMCINFLPLRFLRHSPYSCTSTPPFHTLLTPLSQRTRSASAPTEMLPFFPSRPTTRAATR